VDRVVVNTDGLDLRLRTNGLRSLLVELKSTVDGAKRKGATR